MRHANVKGYEAIHPIEFEGEADPGAVGAGKLWDDGAIIWKRNADNTAWEYHLSKSHANLPDAGTVPHEEIDTRLPTAEEKAALGGTSGAPVSADNRLVDDADPRLSDAREPLPHAESHGRYGSDPLPGVVYDDDPRLQPGQEPGLHAESHEPLGSDPLRGYATNDELAAVADIVDQVGAALSEKADQDDPRLSDAREPLPHEHSEYVQQTDERLTDARTPLPHAESHGPGGSDPITALAGPHAASHAPGQPDALTGYVTEGDPRLSDERYPKAHSDAVHATPSRVAIYAEGELVAERPALNLVGGGVTVTDDPDNYRVNIEVTGGGSGGGGTTAINFPFDAGASVLAVGSTIDIYLSGAHEILGWTILADRDGAVQFDVQACGRDDFPPGSPQSIVAAAPPALSSGQVAYSYTLTDWTTTLPAGSVLRVIIEAATSVRRATLALALRRL